MSSNVTLVAGTSPIELLSTLSSSATMNVIAGQSCACPDWQTIYDLSCGWINSQQSCVTVQQLPFPFTIPVFRLYDLARTSSSKKFAATLTTTYTYSLINNVAYCYPSTSVYLFKTDGNLIPSWDSSGSMTSAFIHKNILNTCNYQIGVAPNVQYDVENVTVNAFSNDNVVASGWSRKGCS
jgi:hypothetical protein